MKTVTFRGNEYTVPDWAKYITQDDHGPIWAWEESPEFDMGEWWKISGSYARYTLVKDAPVVYSNIKEI